VSRSGFQSPKTVLKTAGLGFTIMRRRPHQFSRQHLLSVTVRLHPSSSAVLAVILAVTEPS
jgi:hypothetical protein